LHNLILNYLAFRAMGVREGDGGVWRMGRGLWRWGVG